MMQKIKVYIDKMIDYIDRNSSAYDNDFKLTISLLAVAFLMLLKGDILN